MSIDNWLKKADISIKEYLYSLYHTENSLLFIKPIYLDKRMEVQQSVFLLFHNYIRDIVADSIYKEWGDTNPLTKYYRHKISKEIISEIYKKQIENPIIKFGSEPMIVVQQDSFKKLINIQSKEIDRSKDFFHLAFF